MDGLPSVAQRAKDGRECVTTLELYKILTEKFELVGSFIGAFSELNKSKIDNAEYALTSIHL